MANRDLPELRTLVEVVEQRSFVAAAAILGVTPSAVSQSIARMEARLGRKLLDRSTRTIRPTSLGERMAEAALQAIEGVDQVYRLFDASADQPGGPVRLTVPRVAMELLIQPGLADFTKRHPNVVLELSVEDRLIDLLDNRFDAGIRRGGLVDDTMVARRIAPDDDLILVASPAYTERCAVPKHPRELRKHHCIRVRRRRFGTTPPWRLIRSDERIEVAVTGPLVVDAPDVTRAAAMAGMGIARLARAYVERELSSGLLTRILEGWSEPVAGFHLYYPRQSASSAGLSALRAWLCN